MAYPLTFSRLTSYDAGLLGITVEVSLSLADIVVTVAAKLDTGATNCIFARRDQKEPAAHWV